MEFINQMEPSFNEKERDALYAYMEAGGWVTEYEKTREFEQSISTFTGAKYCSVVNNGTIALSVALMACRVTIGDEIIVPDYTMVATPNAAELIGAKAVFVDVEEDSMCMDFEAMKAAVNKKTKAVILVSINGRYPKNIEEIVLFCKQNQIYLIEDAAQSLGSHYHGKQIGRFGDIGSFSFSAPKIITTGQGGALITDNIELFNRIKQIRDFGREKGGYDHYLVKGWNFKFTDIQAVIGLEQMKKISERVIRKRQMGMLYEKGLKNINGIRMINTDYSETVLWFFDILCEKRDDLILYLKEKGVGTRKFYPALHAEPAFGYQGNYPIAEKIAKQGLWLPSSINLSNEQIDYICHCVRTFYE